MEATTSSLLALTASDLMARQMIDAHIHRTIVVHGNQKSIGIVSSTDLLAAVAYAEDD
jgi:predicted transcriptional regulator